jgi:imidazolonepropionase-like amidohydrolase
MANRLKLPIKFIKKNILILIILLIYACQGEKKVIHLSDGLMISNATIISTEDGNYLPYAGYLVTEGEKIVYVGENEPNLSGTFDVIDGRGKFVIPGLIDSHVHITEVQGMLVHHMEKYPELADEFNKQMPRSYLHNGFTTLINLGGISEEFIAFFNDQPLKPDLYHTGRSGASVANGYPMNFTPEQYRFDAAPNFLYLESEAATIPEKFNPEDHSPKAVVARIKESGAIAVKSYYEPGFGNMDKLPVPTKEIMNRLLEESHSNGLILTAHGNSLESHSFLAEVGVDIIAHGMWNWGKYKNLPKDSLPIEIKRVLDLQIQKQIGYTPTLTVISGEEALADEKFLEDPELRKVVPAKLLEWYKTDEGQWFANELFSELPAEEAHSIYGNIQGHAKLVLKYLSDNGGLILFGTDTPSAPTYGNQPGHNGFWELSLMSESGMPLNKILSSATMNNAKAYNLDDSIGSLAIGKKANMILLTKNPLEEIEAYNAIDKVVIGGKVIARQDLQVKQ